MKEENSEPSTDLLVQSEESNSMGEICLADEENIILLEHANIKLEPSEEIAQPRKRQR